MTDKRATPGTLLLGQILIVDEPAHLNVSTFEGDGSVLLTFNLRSGADISQIILGLTPNQALQMLERLSAYSDVCGRAVAQGRGGARFPDKAP